MTPRLNWTFGNGDTLSSQTFVNLAHYRQNEAGRVTTLAGPLPACPLLDQSLSNDKHVFREELNWVRKFESGGKIDAKLSGLYVGAENATYRIGAPVPDYRACILDAKGDPVGPGVIGRLAVKGPTGCRYLADERHRQYVLNGWNLTGDAYEMDGDGYFYYRSRLDDMIISAGYNIAGAEVEDVLLRHPAVAECGVVGRADEERGQIVEATVVLKPSVQESPELVRVTVDTELTRLLRSSSGVPKVVVKDDEKATHPWNIIGHACTIDR